MLLGVACALMVMVVAGEVNDDAIKVELTPVQPGSSFHTVMNALQSTLSQNPDTLELIMGLKDDPALQAVIRDPAIQAAIRSGDFQSLMGNPKIKALMAHPTVQKISADYAQ